MPTIVQRHKDQLATLDGSLVGTGVQSTRIPFGNGTDGSLLTSPNLIFNTGGNFLTVGGTINGNILNIAGAATVGSISANTAAISGAASIGSLTVSGNEVLHGTLTTGTSSIAATNVQGHVNVTALSAGPVGTWLTTDLSGVVNWNAVPNIAAGWTFDGSKIYANAGIPVRINNLSTGGEMLNVGGTSIFQNTLNVTNGGANITGGASIAGGMTVNGNSVFQGAATANGGLVSASYSKFHGTSSFYNAISTTNGTGTVGQALLSTGSGATYWGQPPSGGGWSYNGSVVQTVDGNGDRVVIGDDFSAGTNFQLSIRGSPWTAAPMWFGPIGPADSAAGGFLTASSIPYSIGMGLLNLPKWMFVLGRNTNNPAFSSEFYRDNSTTGNFFLEQYYNQNTSGAKTLAGYHQVVVDASTPSTFTTHMNWMVMKNNVQKVSALNSNGQWVNACGAIGKTYDGDAKDIWGSVMQKIKELPLGRWRGKGDPEDADRHFTPTAEDFYRVFKIGADPSKDTPGISALDVASIAIAAIKEMHEELDSLKQEIANLKSKK